jgi:hypothetical protein
MVKQLVNNELGRMWKNCDGRRLGTISELTRRYWGISRINTSLEIRSPDRGSIPKSKSDTRLTATLCRNVSWIRNFVEQNYLDLIWGMINNSELPRRAEQNHERSQWGLSFLWQRFEPRTFWIQSKSSRVVCNHYSGTSTAYTKTINCA